MLCRQGAPDKGPSVREPSSDAFPTFSVAPCCRCFHNSWSASRITIIATDYEIDFHVRLNVFVLCRVCAVGSVFPSPWDELDVPLSPFVGWEGGGVSPSPFGGGGEDGNFHWTVLASIVFSYREPWEGQDIKCERRCAPDKLSQVLSSSHELRELP